MIDKIKYTKIPFNQLQSRLLELGINNPQALNVLKTYGSVVPQAYKDAIEYAKNNENYTMGDLKNFHIEPPNIDTSFQFTYEQYRNEYLTGVLHEMLSDLSRKIIDNDYYVAPVFREFKDQLDYIETVLTEDTGKMRYLVDNNILEQIKNNCTYNNQEGLDIGIPGLNIKIPKYSVGMILMQSKDGKSYFMKKSSVESFKNGLKVLFINGEMKDEGDHIRTMIALTDGELTQEHFNTKCEMKQQEMADIVSKHLDSYDINNYIRENLVEKKADFNVNYLETLIKKNKPDVLYIDYLQMMKGAEDPAGLYLISQNLNRIAKHYKVTIVVAVQATKRSVEDGQPPSPKDTENSTRIMNDMEWWVCGLKKDLKINELSMDSLNDFGIDINNVKQEDLLEIINNYAKYYINIGGRYLKSRKAQFIFDFETMKTTTPKMVEEHIVNEIPYDKGLQEVSDNIDFTPKIVNF